MRHCLVIVFLFLLLQRSAYAQDTGIKGKINDDVGKPIVGVEVQVSKDGIRKTTVTNKDGLYNISGLSEGHYIVQITYQGDTAYAGGVSISLLGFSEIDCRKVSDSKRWENKLLIWDYGCPGFNHKELTPLLIDPYYPGKNKTFTSEEIEKMAR